MGRKSGSKKGWNSNSDGTKSKTSSSRPTDTRRSGERQQNKYTRNDGEHKHDHKITVFDRVKGWVAERFNGENSKGTMREYHSNDPWRAEIDRGEVYRDGSGHLIDNRDHSA